jgi:hypothetical protein
LFASIFVVATLSMRTMIPLRVFGILTNIILIASAIPTRNYPTLLLHGVLLPLNASGVRSRSRGRRSASAASVSLARKERSEIRDWRRPMRNLSSSPRTRRAVRGKIHYVAVHARFNRHEAGTFWLSRLRKRTGHAVLR